MRISDETVYSLFSEYDPDCWFCTPEEAAEARARIDALGDFEKLEQRYIKISNRIAWLRRATEYDVNVEQEDGNIRKENCLAWHRRWGRIDARDDRLMKMAKII
jgi:hypothetical protein